MKKIALIGYGYWGPNLLRNLFDAKDCQVVYCCDLSQERLELAKKRYPSLSITTDIEKILNDKNIDGVVIATPTKTHFPLAQKALVSGKDVLIEKPLAPNAKQAQTLAALARKEKRILMVDHTFLFNDAVTVIKKIIDSGEIGNILYINSLRTNLGPVREDTNAIFDLASHDFSIINYLLATTPKSVSTHAGTYLGAQEDIAYIFTEYPKGVIIHVHVSWLAPVRVRQMLIIGTKKMIVYDENEPSEKVGVYDKGVIVNKAPKEIQQMRIDYRIGDVWFPKVALVEPLSQLIREFIDATKTRKQPKSNGRFAADIVKILEGSTKSAHTGRKVVFKNANRS